MHVAVVGSGAAGLSAAWLLSKKHRVTLLERNDRLGGHAHTATVDCQENDDSLTKILKIDTGFIVYNEPSYPNMTRWFDNMGVVTEDSDMSFAVSRDNGGFEYAGGPALGLLAQPTLLLRPRFWSMLLDLLRFYRNAPAQIDLDSDQSLGDFLRQHRYGDAFVNDHLVPFGAAIWSTPKTQILEYPAASFIRFCENHGLLQINNRPQWRTVSGGSEQYVRAVEQELGSDNVLTGFHTTRIERRADGVSISDDTGRVVEADHVVIAAHADEALACLAQPSEKELELLSPFKYEDNIAYLHTDESHMPDRRRAWCSWNYVERSGNQEKRVSLSYWMNRLQDLSSRQNYIVTLNPAKAPDASCTFRKQMYQHPVFTTETWRAQQQLWDLQGQQRTWFCGSYFGSGFHEDAVQSGLAVAEQLGGLIRPWHLDNPSSRVVALAAQQASKETDQQHEAAA